MLSMLAGTKGKSSSNDFNLLICYLEDARAARFKGTKMDQQTVLTNDSYSFREFISVQPNL